MPVYLYWGEDEFAIAQSVNQLKEKVLDPSWLEFNYQKLSGDNAEAIIEGLNEAMTPVFGMGERLIWLVNTNLANQKPSDSVLGELQRTLPVVPTTSHLLLTVNKKIDKRLSSTKLIQKHGEVRDFSLIPPWKTDLIINQVETVATANKLKLTEKAIAALADAVGNDTRQLWNEIAKLKIYRGAEERALNEDDIAALVLCNTQNSLKLAAAIRQGEIDLALGLVTDLINRNEPALKIVATLVGQFRTWTIVKLNQEAGEKDNRVIANAAGINNPNRLYFISKEIRLITVQQLLATSPLLLELEYSLKQGAIALATMQTKIVELCLIFSSMRKN